MSFVFSLFALARWSGGGKVGRKGGGRGLGRSARSTLGPSERQLVVASLSVLFMYRSPLLIYNFPRVATYSAS